MFLRHIFMAGLATACGIAVSAGTFAFLLVIGVIPRMIKRCNFGERILMVENTVILGVLTGAVFSVMEWKAQLPYPWLAHVILGAYGTAAGIFVGCTAVALAEILNTFPILFRRLYINRGLSGVMIAMALGKMAGSFYISFLVTGFQNIGKSIFSNCNLLCVWRIIKGTISYRLKERILNGQICIGYGKICRFGKDCICGGMRVIEK